MPETDGPGESRLVLYFNAGFAVREEFLEQLQTLMLGEDGISLLTNRD